jgi:hypothetical protein
MSMAQPLIIFHDFQSILRSTLFPLSYLMYHCNSMRKGDCIQVVEIAMSYQAYLQRANFFRVIMTITIVLVLLGALPMIFLNVLISRVIYNMCFHSVKFISFLILV